MTNKVPKYSVGDKVVVRSDLIDYFRYRMENSDVMITFIGKDGDGDMDIFMGKEVTISNNESPTAYGSCYEIEEDTDELKWQWSDEMFVDVPKEETKA